MENSTKEALELPIWLRRSMQVVVSGSVILVNAALLLILYIGSTVDLPYQQRVRIIDSLNTRSILVILASIPAIIALITNPNKKTTRLLISIFGFTWLVWLWFILSF